MWERDRSTRKWSYTLAEQFPSGWWKAFGLMLCEELREDLVKCGYLRKFRFVDIKSKYGELRAYTGGVPHGSNAWDIIDKYTVLSRNICEFCGQPDVPMIGKGWFEPECFCCYVERQRKRNNKTWRELWEDYKNERTSEDDDGRMMDVRKYSRYSKESGDWVTVEIDISDTANRIRENYEQRYYR